MTVDALRSQAEAKVRVMLIRFGGAPHTFAGGFPNGQNPPAVLA
jgi:hypothetical protein